MNKRIFLILSATTLALAAFSQSNGITLNSFDWLCGTWQNLRVKPGENASETWIKDGDQLSGTGVTIRGTDTVFVEKLRIISKEDQYYYVADVSHNAAPVYFEIVEISEYGFVCENPQHDFPQKIAYEYDGEILTATISAGEKKIPFRFRKQ